MVGRVSRVGRVGRVCEYVPRGVRRLPATRANSRTILDRIVYESLSGVLST